jgi:hypothetical protein
MGKFRAILLTAALASTLLSTGAYAQRGGGGGRSEDPAAAAGLPEPIFVQLGRAMGALYRPASGTPHVAVLMMHRDGNQMNNIACTEFAKRGLMVLCMNSHFVNNETSVYWEEIPHDVAGGINYLKQKQGITKVVLYGNSGGGVTQSFYQAVAENGPSVCQGPNKLFQCGNDLTGLPKADGIILSDGHPGNPMLRLRSINPSIIGDRDHPRIDPALDPYSVANGFNPNGSSHYSEDFKRRYFAAQSARMNKLIVEAQALWADIKAGKNFYSDDAPFTIPGFDDGRLESLDLSIRHTTAQPEKLLKNDGTIVTELVPNLGPARIELAKDGRTFREGARGGLTVHAFLSSNAIKSTYSMDESKIDLCSSNNSTPCMLQHVTVPLLAGAQQASFQQLVPEIESNYLLATMKDKDYIVVEGATTGSTPCTNCELPASTYSNATKNWFDYATAWINKRFS